MPRKANKTSTMGRVGVIQARVLGFEAFARSVECGSLQTNLGNEIAGDVGLEADRIVGFRIRPQSGVEKWSYCWFEHSVSRYSRPDASVRRELAPGPRYSKCSCRGCMDFLFYGADFTDLATPELCLEGGDRSD